MRSACCGPSSSSDIRLAAYDTDSVEPLAIVIGRLTFHIDVRHANSVSIANSAGSGKVVGNDQRDGAIAPAAIVALT